MSGILGSVAMAGWLPPSTLWWCPVVAGARSPGCRFPRAGVRSKTIEQVNRDEYQRLQALVVAEIAADFKPEIHPVQYDDIMWRELNPPPQSRQLP